MDILKFIKDFLITWSLIAASNIFDYLKEYYLIHKTKEKLCQDFYVLTDTAGGPISSDWKKYAKWLENLAFKKLNNKILKENQFFKSRMQEVIEILEKSINTYHY